MHHERRISLRGKLRRSRKGQAAPGFSLVEVLIVLAIMGVMAAAVIPFFDPLADDQIRSVAEVVAADLAYARNLAVSHQSSYRLTFSIPGNQYTLTHSGANTLLDVLPHSAFHKPGESPDRLSVFIDELPQMSRGVALAKIAKLTPAEIDVPDIEFGPYGQTTRGEITAIWLQLGRGDRYRSIKLSVDPVTGIVEVGPVEAAPPP